MANYCLPRFAAEAVKRALKTGELSPKDLAAMSSEGRREVFMRYMNEPNARNTNALFESKLLLQNQQRGMITWAKKITGITPETRRDLIAKAQRIEKALDPEELDQFLEDFVAKRLGFDVTEEEAKTIAKLASEAEEAKLRIPDNAPIRSRERMRYGARAVAFKEYTDALKAGSTKDKLVKYTNPLKLAEMLGGLTKSIVASFDNSFFGNQGLKLLFTNPDIWGRNFLKSWVDISRALKGEDAIKYVQADIISRPNALNGKYKAGKFDLDVLSEEAFPSTLPGKIPVLKRVYKASEAAYNGAALRMRADYADRIIRTAERNGLDTSSTEEMAGLGHLVNSLTGRGSIGVNEGTGNFINALFFSIRFLKSNIDTLSFGTADKAIRNNPLALKIAATNTLKIAAGIGSLLAVADAIQPGSVEWDPRSPDFGQIKVGNTRFNVSGGMASLVTLGARLVSGSTKSPITGRIKELNTGDYGSKTKLDVAESFLEGKFSPLFGILRDYLKGHFYDFEPFTVEGAVQRLVTPLPVQTGVELLENPDAAPFLAAMIASGLGFSANTYGD